jgi:Deoxyribonuclease II
MNQGVRRRLSWQAAFPIIIAILLGSAGIGRSWADATPGPLLAAGKPALWWVVFKFNASAFAGCGAAATPACTFGGTVQDYASFGEQYAFASDQHPSLEKGTGCNGETTADPLGATFDEVYNGNLNYVIWNDQFYDDPVISGCSKECGSPWGHSKGMVAWNNAGNGFVLQVSTPSWPAAGSSTHPRQSDGNTLGCVKDNDVLVSQHFFALTLTKADLIAVLQGLTNASVVTDPSNPQIVNNGGPTDVQTLVRNLGTKSKSKTVTMVTLSTGVRLIAKPSAVHVPPWQLVSAELGGVPLRTATWWASPKIPTTAASTQIDCWDAQLGTAGAIEVATTGKWQTTTLGLKGTASASGNHAKIGVTTDGGSDLAIFGDLNQQGVVNGAAADCKRSQNGRGGLFYVVKDHDLANSVGALIAGETAPAQ